MFAGVPAVANAAPVDLATAAAFVVLGGQTVTNTGTSVLNGDLGVSPGTALPGFGTAVVNGATHANDAVAAQAQLDLTTAYDIAAGLPATQDLSGTDLGNRTLKTGVYRFSSSAGLTNTLVLDAENNPDAQFVFQIGSSLTTASASRVTLINGASPCNVFWKVTSSATLGSFSSFKGNVLALTSITMTTGATLTGRALARNGAVTLDTNGLDRSTCDTGSSTVAARHDLDRRPGRQPDDHDRGRIHLRRRIDDRRRRIHPGGRTHEPPTRLVHDRHAQGHDDDDAHARAVRRRLSRRRARQDDQARRLQHRRPPHRHPLKLAVPRVRARLAGPAQGPGARDVQGRHASEDADAALPRMRLGRAAPAARPVAVHGMTRHRPPPPPAAIALAAGAAVCLLAAPAQAAISVPASQTLAVLQNDHAARATPSAAGRLIETVAVRRPLTGVRTVLPVIGRRRAADGSTWLRVRLPGRPLGHTGWIAASNTRRDSTEWHVVIRLAARQVVVYRDGLVERRFSAVVGKSSTPTPRGRFFVEEAVALAASDTGAPFALASSARSQVLQQFEGGPGQIAAARHRQPVVAARHGRLARLRPDQPAGDLVDGEPHRRRRPDDDRLLTERCERIARVPTALCRSAPRP